MTRTGLWIGLSVLFFAGALMGGVGTALYYQYEEELGEELAQQVMRTIRRDAAHHPASSLLVWAEPLVWRVASVAALVALGFAGSVAVYTKQHAVPVAAVWLEEFEAGSPFPDK